jgi:hypothetical protein
MPDGHVVVARVADTGPAAARHGVISGVPVLPVNGAGSVSAVGGVRSYEDAPHSPGCTLHGSRCGVITTEPPEEPATVAPLTRTLRIAGGDNPVRTAA